MVVVSDLWATLQRELPACQRGVTDPAPIRCGGPDLPVTLILRRRMKQAACLALARDLVRLQRLDAATCDRRSLFGDRDRISARFFGARLAAEGAC